MELRIRLFGELDLRRGEEPLPPLESARAESLLAYPRSSPRFRAIRDASLEQTTDAVHMLTGQQARTSSEFAQRNAAAAFRT